MKFYSESHRYDIQQSQPCPFCDGTGQGYDWITATPVALDPTPSSVMTASMSLVKSALPNGQPCFRCNGRGWVTDYTGDSYDSLEALREAHPDAKKL